MTEAVGHMSRTTGVTGLKLRPQPCPKSARRLPNDVNVAVDEGPQRVIRPTGIRRAARHVRTDNPPGSSHMPPPPAVNRHAKGTPFVAELVNLVMFLCSADRAAMPPRIPRRPGRTPAAAGILDPDGTWLSTPLRTEKRAKATIERAERGIAALGKGVPFLIVYYGTDGAGGWQPLDRPLRTVTTLDRFGLVTWDGRTPMLRMLQVPELRRAMGFGSGYSLDAITQRRERIKILGNGVAPLSCGRSFKL